jgi:septum formation protein
MAISLILASESSYRRELLRQMGIEFRAFGSQYAEVMDNAMPPDKLVMHNALGKALALQQAFPRDLILGADTIVFQDGHVLGKPHDMDKAIGMLQMLQGRWHTVHTGMVLIEGNKQVLRCETTRVKFRPLNLSQICTYLSKGESVNAAGSYSILGMGAGLVEMIEGCYTNIVGLSLPVLVDMLLEFDRPVY